MNPVWKPGAGGQRDPFQAFVCDDHSLDLIRMVAGDLGWISEKVHKGGLRNAVQNLSITASPQILFVDLSESTDPLHDIGGLAEVCEPGTIVIAAGQINDVRLYRDFLASGIHDYLLKPFSVEQVREALVSAQAILSAPREVAPGEAHNCVAVIGARGGAGASTITTSLAWLLSEQSKQKTALLDLDLHFGTNALTMDLEPGRGLIDAIDNPGRIDGLFIERAMVNASERLALLSAEAAISQPIYSDGGAFMHLLEEFRSAFDWSVIDLPRSTMMSHVELLGQVDVGLLVTELTLASARDTIRILAWLKTNAPDLPVILVANKTSSSPMEISRKDFEQSVERQIDIVIASDSRISAQSAKLGKTMAETAKGSKLAASFSELLQKVSATARTSQTGIEEEKSALSLMDRLGELKNLLGSKRKDKVAAEG